jgi:hypothetical protein
MFPSVCSAGKIVFLLQQGLFNLADGQRCRVGASAALYLACFCIYCVYNYTSWDGDWAVGDGWDYMTGAQVLSAYLIVQHLNCWCVVNLNES